MGRLNYDIAIALFPEVANDRYYVLNVENFPENLAAVIENKDTVRFVGTRKVIETAVECFIWAVSTDLTILL